MALLLACLQPTSGTADSWSVGELHKHGKSVLFGFLGGLFAHELGHMSVATVRGIDFEFDGLSIVYPEPDLSDKDRLLARGLDPVPGETVAQTTQRATLRWPARGEQLQGLYQALADCVYGRRDTDGDGDRLRRRLRKQIRGLRYSL